MRLLELGGRRLPVLRWSFLRMGLGVRKLTREWQVGDGREAALRDHVLATAKPDLDDVIRVIDEFAYHQSYLINVGDEKGAILDAAIRSAAPTQLLELGTYCGYSALRTARVMGPDARLTSLEFNPDNAEIARAIIAHAQAADRVTVVDGVLADDHTADRLEAEHGFGAGTLDFVFIDHEKNAYLPDLERIVARGWLHEGSVAVADNVKFPGAPAYKKHMEEQEGKTWRTTEHQTHAEYQTLIKDLVLESRYLG